LDIPLNAGLIEPFYYVIIFVLGGKLRVVDYPSLIRDCNYNVIIKSSEMLHAVGKIVDATAD